MEKIQAAMNELLITMEELAEHIMHNKQEVHQPLHHIFPQIKLVDSS